MEFDTPIATQEHRQPSGGVVKNNSGGHKRGGLEAVQFRVQRKGTGFPMYWVSFPSTLVKKLDSQKGTQFPK